MRLIRLPIAARRRQEILKTEVVVTLKAPILPQALRGAWLEPLHGLRREIMRAERRSPPESLIEARCITFHTPEETDEARARCEELATDALMALVDYVSTGVAMAGTSDDARVREVARQYLSFLAALSEAIEAGGWDALRRSGGVMVKVETRRVSYLMFDMATAYNRCLYRVARMVLYPEVALPPPPIVANFIVFSMFWGDTRPPILYEYCACPIWSPTRNLLLERAEALLTSKAPWGICEGVDEWAAMGCVTPFQWAPGVPDDILDEYVTLDVDYAKGYNVDPRHYLRFMAVAAAMRRFCVEQLASMGVAVDQAVAECRARVETFRTARGGHVVARMPRPVPVYTLRRALLDDPDRLAMDYQRLLVSGVHDTLFDTKYFAVVSGGEVVRARRVTREEPADPLASLPWFTRLPRGALVEAARRWERAMALRDAVERVCGELSNKYAERACRGYLLFRSRHPFRDAARMGRRVKKRLREPHI